MKAPIQTEKCADEQGYVFSRLAFFQTRICVPFRTRTLEPNVIRLRGARGRDRG